MPSILKFDVVKNVGVGGIWGWFGGLTGKNSGGVTPLSETSWKSPVCRSLYFAWRTGVGGCRLRMAGEAEASSAGEQLAKDYPAGTHRTDVVTDGLGRGHDGSFPACWPASGR